MRTALGPSRTSCCLHRTVSISDTLFVTPKHARVGLRNRPMRSPVPPDFLRRSVLCVDLRVEGPHVTPPVRARWAWPESAFRRLENLRAETHRPIARVLFIVCAQPHTVSPSLHPCPASDRASDFLLASALSCSAPRDLAISRRTRRATCPIDFCHPNETCVHPHLVCSRLRCRGFHRVGASRSLGSERLDRGTERFHGARIASADRRGHTVLCLTVCIWPRAPQVVGLPGDERGRFLPTAPSIDRASDIPVASPSSARGEPDLRRRSSWSVKEPPRPP